MPTSCVCGHEYGEHIQDPAGHCLYAVDGEGCECPEYTPSR